MIFHRLPLRSETFKKSQMSEPFDVPSGCYGPDVLYEVIVQVSAVHAILELFHRFYKILEVCSFVDIYSVINLYLFLTTLLAINDVEFRPITKSSSHCLRMNSRLTIYSVNR